MPNQISTQEVRGVETLVKTHPDFLHDFLDRDKKAVLKTLEKLKAIALEFESKTECFNQEIVKG